jgi:TonB-linked SusC/RagA family outer membrane protein
VTSYDAYGRPIAVNASAYSYPGLLIMPGSSGTNWWDAVFGSAPVGDYNLDIAGGATDHAYRVSFNYFDQKGTAKYNDYRRGSVRANTSFSRNKLNFGENVLVAMERSYGGMGDPGGGTSAEDGIMGKNILMEPVIPVYDIAGNFAGPKGLNLNQSNPLAYAFQRRNDIRRDLRIFGNTFGGFDFTPQLAFKSSLGFNVGQGGGSGFGPITPENAEPNNINNINENDNTFTNWNWANTLTYGLRASSHSLNLLLGQAAGGGRSRFITASMANLLNDSPDNRFINDALGDASTKNVFSSGGRYAEMSFFGKADYNFADKYVASLTVRKDGSSRLGPTHRWGTFPAFGLGWRLSNEPFLSGNRVFSDVMLRYGYGVTGNQNIPSGRVVSQFGGSRGDTFYDISGTNSLVAGYRQTSLGNPDLKWEENRSSNVGTDMVLFDGLFNVVLDVYARNTNNLLFNPATPATAGVAAPPIVNIGKMRNTGFDFSIGHVSSAWNVTFNGSHYSNKIVSIDGVQNFFYGPVSTRFGNQVINKVGSPIGSFYGRVADGYFSSDADALAHTPAGNCGPVSTTNPAGTGVFCQDGAAAGRIKFRDINGDGKIDDTNDRTIIGNPHPKFTGGLDLGARRGNFDLSATFFGSFGNDIFENQKEFYVFREFGTNVKNDLLANSWTPTNQNAKYPRLDVNDKYSFAISSYYVEDGSYVRLRNVQLGYNVPSSMSRWLSATRVYIQADNLLTITGYEGLDPVLPAPSIFAGGDQSLDIRDQYLGVDRGAYPSNRIFSIGVVTSF